LADQILNFGQYVLLCNLEKLSSSHQRSLEPVSKSWLRSVRSRFGKSLAYELELLGRSANVDLSQVERVILLVLSWTEKKKSASLLACNSGISIHFTGRSIGILLDECRTNVGPASNRVLSVESRFALLLHSAAVLIWPLHGRFEAIFAEQIDVGLCARGLVVGVAKNADLGELGCHVCRVGL
jgi:hypothetical protein